MTDRYSLPMIDPNFTSEPVRADVTYTDANTGQPLILGDDGIFRPIEEKP